MFGGGRKKIKASKTCATQTSKLLNLTVSRAGDAGIHMTIFFYLPIYICFLFLGKNKKCHVKCPDWGAKVMKQNCHVKCSDLI